MYIKVIILRVLEKKRITVALEATYSNRKQKRKVVESEKDNKYSKYALDNLQAIY